MTRIPSADAQDIVLPTDFNPVTFVQSESPSKGSGRIS